MALPDSLPRVSQRALALGVLGAVLHLSAVRLLLAWFEFSLSGLPFAYAVCGALVLGAIPALCLAAGRLLAPAVVVLGALSASAYATWATYLRPATPPTPVDPTPFGWYLLGWVAVAAVAVVAGGVEYAARRRWGSPNAENAT